MPQIIMADETDEKKVIEEGVFFEYAPDSEDLENFKKHMLPEVKESDGGVNMTKVAGLVHQYLKKLGYLNLVHKDYRKLDTFIVAFFDLNNVSLRMSVNDFVDRTLAGGFKIPVPNNLTNDGKVPEHTPEPERGVIFKDDWIK